ncbi:MAG: peptidylprolyl isomerase [Bacilli bacterium]|nr:peptidylprolyl isomerase [Bacilli bacterium]
MKKKIILAAAILLLVSGCGEVPKLSNGDDAVVTFKNGDMISANDLYNEIKSDYALSAIVNLIDKNILEQEYKDDLEDAKEYASSTIDAMLEQYEDEATLLQAIQYYTGYATIEAYQDSLYLSYLQNLAVEDYAKTQVTEKQIKDYYKDEVYGDVSVNHILITPDVKENASDSDKKEAETAAKEKAEDLIKKLKEAEKNNEDISKVFAKLAKENSKDDATKNKNGSLGFVNYGTLSSEYNELLDAAYKLNDKEFSTEVIKTSLGYHVIYRVEIKEKASLEDKKEEIIETLSKELLAKDATISINALKELRKEYGVEITDSEIQKQYALYIQNALSRAQNTEE